MTQFINIHTLISHSSSLLNRDDAGMQKTAIFGGTTRTRISSQCLKRANALSVPFAQAKCTQRRLKKFQLGPINLMIS